MYARNDDASAAHPRFNHIKQRGTDTFVFLGCLYIQPIDKRFGRSFDLGIPADDPACFVLDFKDEFFFLRISLARCSFAAFLADIGGFFFCQIFNKKSILPLPQNLLYSFVINTTVST